MIPAGDTKSGRNRLCVDEVRQNVRGFAKQLKRSQKDPPISLTPRCPDLFGSMSIAKVGSIYNNDTKLPDDSAASDCVPQDFPATFKVRSHSSTRKGQPVTACSVLRKPYPCPPVGYRCISTDTFAAFRAA